VVTEVKEVIRYLEASGPKRGELEELPRTNNNVYKVEIAVMDPELSRVKVHVIFVENPVGDLKEIFLSVGRNGSLLHETCRDLGIAWSRQLRLGLPVPNLVRDLIGERGVIKGMTDHPLIKSVLSIKDLVGKVIAYEYLGETGFLNPEVLDGYRQSLDYSPPRVDELNLLKAFRANSRKAKKLTEFPETKGTNAEAGKPALDHVAAGVMPKTHGNGHGHAGGNAVSSAASGASGLHGAAKATLFGEALPTGGLMAVDTFLGKMMGDAPDCDSCGFKTVRNGACYKCLNCGASMGCS
jgi:ribonucleoside-diphosphate reductase alpha chain